MAPYILAPSIRKDAAGLWGEGEPYSSNVIYDICSENPSQPPVHYEQHSLKPHSICHFDAPGHIFKDGHTIEQIFSNTPNIFYGSTTVLRLPTPRFSVHKNAPNIQHWEVSLEEIRNALEKHSLKNPKKLLLTFEGADKDFYSIADHAFTISIQAAEWLTSLQEFSLFGTIWKSVDFQPGQKDRPIHRELFKAAGILECLNLSEVPSGEYFLSAFPLPLEGATESPVCPVLFTKNEIKW